MATIGLLVGRENTFPQPFIDAINARNIPGISAEFVKLGGTALDEDLPYRVIVDRISHEVPYYRCYLKSAVLRGVTVINDPFWWGGDDKFLECHIARRVGVAVPRSLLIPNKEYVEGITDESLRNLRTPLDWEAMLDYVGRPAFMKPAIGGGWKNVYKVHDTEELVRCYDQTGQLQMMLQEAIDYEQYVRCICIGRDKIRVARYDPGAPFHERYGSVEGYLAPDLYERIVGDARKLCTALGYDMNTVEFAVRDGIPYAIDFLNPAPDFDNFSIGEDNFNWVLQTMTDLVVAYAQGDGQPGRGYEWRQDPFRVTPPASPFAQGAEGAEAPASGVSGAVPVPGDDVVPTVEDERVGADPLPADLAPVPVETATAEAAPSAKPRGRSRGATGKAKAGKTEATAVSAPDGVPEENETPAPKPRRSRKKAE